MMVTNQSTDVRLDVGQFQSQVTALLQVESSPLVAEDCICMAETSFYHVRAGKSQKEWLSCHCKLWIFSAVLVPEVAQTSAFKKLISAAISTLNSASSHSRSGSIPKFSNFTSNGVTIHAGILMLLMSSDRTLKSY